jgi:hypothetical protein
LFYDSDIAALNSSSNFYVNVYYKNNNTNNNVAYSYPTGYTLTGFPSAPRNVSQIASAANSVTIQYYDPSYGDALNPTNAATVNAYQLTYQSYSAAARYGGAVSVSSTTVSATAPSTTTVTPGATATNNASKAISVLYPDASYSVTVKAQNTGNTTYGASSTVFYASTAALTVPTTSYNISGLFPTNTGSSTNYYSVASAATVNNLIVETSALAKTTTSAFKAVVNDYSTRGTNGSTTSKMYLTASVSGAATAIGANVAFNTVYPIGTLPSAVTLNNITITPTGVVDYYSSGATGGVVTGSDGFYQEATCNMTLAAGLLAPSSSQYTVTLSRSCTSGVTPTSSSYSFYYDNLTGSPNTLTIGTPFALGTVTSRAICGVNVIYGTPAFTVSYSANNMGNYFYKSPLVNYSSVDSNSNTIISATQTTIPASNTTVTAYGTKLNTTVTFTSMAVSGGTSSSVFTTSIPLTITANNINGSTSISATAIAAIIDGPSYTLVNSMASTPANIPQLTNTTAVAGARIWSGLNPGTYELAVTTAFSNANLLNSGASYSTLSTLYDHSQTIASGNYIGELQIANGKFQTKTGSTTAYLNYSTLYYGASLNTANYSAITATTGTYRYSTFVWKIPSSTATSYTSVTFTINGPSPAPSYNGTTSVASIGGEAIKFFYRIEDATSAATAQVGSSISTSWINANSKTGSQANSTTYVSPSAYSPYYGVTRTGTTNGTSYSVSIPATSWTGSTYLYCRIGLPMAQTFSFTGMNAAFGTDTY